MISNEKPSFCRGCFSPQARGALEDTRVAWRRSATSAVVMSVRRTSVAKDVAKSLQRESVKSFLDTICTTFNELRARETAEHTAFRVLALLIAVNFALLLIFGVLRSSGVFLVYNYSVLFLFVLIWMDYNPSIQYSGDYIHYLNMALKPCQLAVTVRNGNRGVEIKSLAADERNALPLRKMMRQ